MRRCPHCSVGMLPEAEATETSHDQAVVAAWAEVERAHQAYLDAKREGKPDHTIAAERSRYTRSRKAIERAVRVMLGFDPEPNEVDA